MLFSPRGGSAQVARSIAHELPVHGWDVTIVSGSCEGLGDARQFYAGLDVVAVDFDAGDAPMHPSYEDRPGAPDRCFAMVGDEEYAEHVAAWERALTEAGAPDADLLHLHHLTPLNEAAARVAPGVPIVGHLHGTELLMLEQIAAGAPDHWVHADAWAARMRRWAKACERLLVLTPGHAERAQQLLGIDPACCVVAPNGFDPQCFKPADIDRDAFWREQLLEEPRGWLPGQEVGTITYEADEVARMRDAVVLIAVGRYTEVKRLGLLIRAFAKAQRETKRHAALVILGGHPGEYEAEHPADAIVASGAQDVFLAGWRDHADLPAFFNAADVQVLASVREQFGLVLVEGMACGLPPIAVNRYGPSEIVRDGETGWLVEPDDEAALAQAIVAAVDDPEGRSARGIAARRAALEQWSWPSLAAALSDVLADVAGMAPDGAHTKSNLH
ncbi:MAG TPA: glycosyltransferase family 4 protein [Baekduia sp.]|nr:glycosyltransferase family 4 protein [Baekduia sp.]